MTRLHIVTATAEGKTDVLYVGESGAEADKAYDKSKHGGEIQQFRFPSPARTRAGGVAAKETVIRTRELAGKTEEQKPEKKPDSK